MLKNLDKAPFPWFGGKSRAAAAVWALLGDVPHYVEPFFGGWRGAARPSAPVQPALLLGDGERPRRASGELLAVHPVVNRSEAQFRIKALNGAEAYRATDLDEGIGAHWRQYGELHERGHSLAEVYREHFLYTLPTEQGLVRDPAPYRRWEAR